MDNIQIKKHSSQYTASEKSLYNAIILANKIYKNRKNAKKIIRTKLFK